MKPLSYLVCVPVLVVFAYACGPDAEKRYAGLDEASVSLEDGPGYRLRFLAPPWERIGDDPLALGKVQDVAFGASAVCSGSPNDCRTIEPDSATVLEVDSASVSQTPGVITYPKYRLEAVFLRCSAEELASTDVCADVLAEQDELGRSSAEGDDQVLYARPGENDAGQPYRDLLSVSRSSLRYRRVVYVQTEAPDLTLRLAFEANPSLAEEEVTRMIDACEVTEAGDAP